MDHTQPWSSLTTVTFDGKIISQQEIFDSLAQQLKEFDTQNSHPYTELDIDEDPTGKPTAVQATLDPAVQATVTPAVAALSAAASIGQVLGSAIGHALAPNNPFAQLAAGTVAGAIGQQLSQAIAQGGLSFDGTGMPIAGVFQGFNVNLEGAASGAVASFLAAEIGTALGLHGFGALLFDTAVGSYAGSVLQQVLHNTLNGVVDDIDWSAGLGPTEGNIFSAIGQSLAHQLVTAHTQAGAIGGQLVGAIGSIIGLSIGKVLGMSLDIILPGVGSLIGTILGTWLGDLFAPDPAHPYAESTIDPSTYSYGGHVVYVGGGGDSAVSNAMADTASSVVNAYLTSVGGVALASSMQLHIGYQTNNQATPYWWSEPTIVHMTDGDGNPIDVPGQISHLGATADAIISAAALDLLHNTEAVGGDLFLKRAHQHSQYTDTETLAGDLQVAQDYELYLNNREAINALIAVNPNTAFTAGWVDTFVRVNDLGLNQYGASDFLGGLPGYLDSVKKAGLTFYPGNLTVKRGSDGSVTIAIHVPGNVDIPGALSAFASHTNEIDDATGKTIQLVFADGLAVGGFHGPASASLVSGVWQVAGGAGNNIWIARDDVPNSFQAAAGSYNILLGGAMADVIHAGNNGDYVDGGAGNDQIFGGSGNDILRGGPGNDTLQGGLGNDAYEFGRGDGADIVFDSGGQDSLVFGPGIKASDISVQLSSNGTDLIVGVRDPANPNVTFAQLTDRITLQSWTNPLDRIEKFTFADGTVLDLSAGGIDVVTSATLAGGSVAENSANGTAVGTVTGTDLDLAAVLHYQLIDNAGGRFAIDPSTGAITVANGSLLDYETATSHVIDVRVTDQSGHSLDQNFNLNVTNVNEAPVLTVPSANVTAIAGQPLPVASLFSASDPEHDALTYYLYDNTVATTGGHFALNGSALPNDTLDPVTAAQLAQTTFVAGAAGTSDDLLVRVSDGQLSTGWSEFHVTAVPKPPVNDFNGDHMSDIVWRNDAGAVVIWDMNDGNILAGNSLGTMPSNWTVAGTGDFNGDGKTDLLWRNSSNDAAVIWDMNDGNILASNSLGTVPSSFTVAGTGDFNGDGKTDILWRNTSSNVVSIWDMNDGNILVSNSLGIVPSNFTVAGTGDFNGDGKTDILWRNTTNNVASIWDMNDGNILSANSLGTVPANFAVAGTGDFNGDGKTDILWRNTTNNVASIWDMNDGNILAANSLGTVPANWTVADIGDFNGDHKADILWRNDAGSVAIWDMNDGNILATHDLGVVPSNWHIIV